MDLPVQQAVITSTEQLVAPAPKKSFPTLALIFALLFAATLVIGIFLFLRVQSLQKQLSSLSSPSPTISPLNSLNNGSTPVEPTSLPTSSSDFVCPETAWVDCMPAPGGTKNPQCQPEYLQWAQANCPDFQGGAL